VRRLKRLFFRVSLVISGLIALVTLWIIAPVWLTPIAKLWYEPGFEQAVEKALAEIPGSENACIYDDSLGIYVTSIQQLQLERMIERAVQDRVSLPSLDPVLRHPHFRVYAGDETYYWSFRSKQLQAFRSSTWTLEGYSVDKCSDLKRSPGFYQNAFRDSYGIEVGEENFCCGSSLPIDFLSVRL